MPRTYFTISTGSHLAGALALAASLQRAEPDRRFYLFLVDHPIGIVETGDPSMTVIDGQKCGIPEFQDMASRYTAMEFCCALKPFAFDYVFDVLKCEQAVYLDADIFVLAPLDHVHDALDRGAACVLTPHVTGGLRDGRFPDEDGFLTAGMFNLGFAAFRNVPQARAFVSWWRGKLRQDCVLAMDRGIFLDQSYCNFAPCFIEHCCVLRNPGYNLAFWNLAQRPVSKEDGRYLTGSELVRFVHFSALEHGNASRVSKYENRFSWDASGDFREIIEAYVAEIERHDVYSGGCYSALPYGFNRLVEVRRIEEEAASRLRRHRADTELDNALTSPLPILWNFFRRVCRGYRHTAAHWEKVRRARESTR